MKPYSDAQHPVQDYWTDFLGVLLVSSSTPNTRKERGGQVTDRGQRTGTRGSVCDPDVLAAVPCPIERAKLASRWARRRGNLPPALADLRTSALHEARSLGHTVRSIALAIAVTERRVYDLLNRSHP
jgi:hypothetical protein